MSSVRPVPAEALPTSIGPVSNQSGDAFGVVLKAVGSDRNGRVGALAEADQVNTMLLQEIRREEEGRRNRAQLRRGRDMLGLLARLQRDLVAGDGAQTAECPANDTIENLLAPGPDAADAALGRIVQAIALRLKVELARRGSSGP